MASPMNVVKAGALLRSSTILHRWKKGWFVLYANGDFKYFEDQNHFYPKANIHIPTECVQVIPHKQARDVPQGYTAGCIFSIVTYDSDWRFCAESADDAAAWRLALSEAKQLTPAVSRQWRNHPELDSIARAGYTDGEHYYQHASSHTNAVPLYDASTAPYSSTRTVPRVPIVYRGVDGELVVPQQVIEHPDGSRTIILGDGNEICCRCRRGYYCGCCDDYGASSALFGLTAGALMMSPFLWTPLFWC